MLELFTNKRIAKESVSSNNNQHWPGKISSAKLWSLSKIIKITKTRHDDLIALNLRLLVPFDLPVQVLHRS